MTIIRDPSSIRTVPLDRISVVNPRKRNRDEFQEIVRNIESIGLKRPITVAPRQSADGDRYDLVCGQGRLEAYQALGQREIPVITVDANHHQCLIMSLVENIARRKRRPLELLQRIAEMMTRGEDETSIAKRVGLTVEYVRGIVQLLQTREHRLLRAVEWGQIPVSIAVRIAGCSNDDLRSSLREAYENGTLRGKQLIAARRLVEQRLRSGRGFSRGNRGQVQTLSSAELVRTYQDDVERKQLLIRDAEGIRQRLAFIIGALRGLLADEQFVAVLRTEQLDSLPGNLADRLRSQQCPILTEHHPLA